MAVLDWIKRRPLEKTFILLNAVVFVLLFLRLYTVQQKNLSEIPARLTEGSVVNLNDAKQGAHMKFLLQKGYYFEDQKDIDLVSAVIERGFASGEGDIDNIGELNKQRFFVNADEAFVKGGEVFKKRVRLSRQLLGFTDDDSLFYQTEISKPQSLSPAADVAMGGRYSISGKIYVNGQAAAGVLVRLQMVVPQDSLYSNDEGEEEKMIIENSGNVKKIFHLDSLKQKRLQTFFAYARSDANGSFSFAHLPEGKAYEVLPLKPGYQFGPSKGIGELNGDENFSFYQAPHTLKLFSTRDFNNLKKEKALIVRTPGEASHWYWIIVISFLACFLLLHFLLKIRFPNADQVVLPVIMLLTGLSLLVLLSMQDPLRDRFLGKSTFINFLAGIAAIIFLLFINLRRFTTDSNFYRFIFFKRSGSASNGWPWALAALGLLLLTILFGTGPEGSGVKVNLLGFQPSEIVKFLLIVFLAGYFASNEKFISAYVQWRKRWNFFVLALFAIVGAILLFLVLGDLGPAMVCCFTFIILFSFSRGDFLFTVGAVVLYILSIWLVKNIWLSTLIIIGILILSSIFIRRGLSESSVMTLVVIGGFLLLDQVPYLSHIVPGPMQRLTDRKAIWQNPWDNEVFGGDQIANGIWGMSSGGVTGQGIGEGFPKTIPEAHTDMILPSLGEEFGWAGILCIFILFLIYLHRAVIIGRQTGRPFLFYLCAGIGVGTFVQFLLIAGGSTGALPLSGVSLPFLSYGGSSLIINMLAAGVLLSASLVRGSEVQMKYVSKQQDKNLVPALLAATIAVVLLSINVSRYLFRNAKWVVQPALVADRGGARIFSYNPRIAILMNRLQAGNLFDRNGLVLATSSPDSIKKQTDTLVKTGLDPAVLQTMIHRRQDRYYPFAEQMFFWTGDNNTGIFMGGTNGYFAEYEHVAELRGFPAPETNFTVKASHFSEERFLPRRETEMTVVKRDYSALAPLLLAGINSKKVEAFKKRNRNVRLTMDASLQTSIQNALQNLDSLKDSRISVVVMEDSTGDVLASASYPLPTLDDPDKLTLTISEQNKLPYWLTNSDIGFTLTTQPGSSAKLITAMAAFNKLGMAAATKTIVVRPEDLIRTKSDEPDEAGTITIERGLVRSNNPFFIRLANEEHLQEEMATLYMQTGMFLRGVGGYYYEGDLDNTAQQNKWRELWRRTEFQSQFSYNRNNIRATRGRGISGMAWGQGELVAAPAAIARIASAIANNGIMMPNRYVLKIADSLLPLKRGVAIAKDPQYAALMTKYMKEQSAPKIPKLGIAVAGKTGTPERIVKQEKINDGWFVFFAPKQKGGGHIVTCIRIEKCRGSSIAVRLAGSKIIPILREKGYIKSFETSTPLPDSLHRQR